MLSTGLRANHAAVGEYLAAAGAKVFKPDEIDSLLLEQRAAWGIGKSVSTKRFAAYLVERHGLKPLTLEFPYRPATRFAWGDVGILPIAMSIDSKGYFSHYSALFLHRLTEQFPKSVYFNREQRNSGGGGQLSQRGIDYAFRKPSRVTSNIAVYDDFRVCLLNGKNTGQLGVIEAPTPEGAVRVTDLERTLIDATVRPVYAGGAFEVLKAYKRAREEVSVSKLISYLKQLAFSYPYHQAIGFYLERAGYPAEQVDKLREFAFAYDFYLDYGLRQSDYVPDWRLFVPQGF